MTGSKPCPDNKIRNPATGRCVDKNGKLGKALLAAEAAPAPAAPTPAPVVATPPLAVAAEKNCPDGKILNPATGRCVDINGKLGKQLAAAAAPPKPKSKTPNAPAPKPKSKTPEDAYEMKQAKIWVRAPWRDLENNALQARKEKWTELYARFAPYFDKIFTVKGKQYALDIFSNSKITLELKGMTYQDFQKWRASADYNKIFNKIKLLETNIDQFNRIELALLIANCVISYYTFDHAMGDRIEAICFTLLRKYYDKNTTKVPYIKTLGYKTLLVYEENTFFMQLGQKWKSTLPNNLLKYPYNELIPM